MKIWLFAFAIFLPTALMAKNDDADFDINMTIHSGYLPTYYFGGSPGYMNGSELKINKAPKGGPVTQCYLDNCNILSNGGYDQILADHENAILTAAEEYSGHIDTKMSDVKDDMQRILDGAMPKLDSATGQLYKKTFDQLKSKDKEIGVLIESNRGIDDHYRVDLVDVANTIAESDLSTNNLNYAKISHSQAMGIVARAVNSGNLSTAAGLKAEDLADISDLEVPYDFKTDSNSEFGQTLQLTKKYNFYIRRELSTSGMLHYTEDRLLYLANHLLGVSDEFWSELHDPETARSYLDMAGQFIDMAIGIGVPLYGSLGDAYEFFTGENELTGEKLSTIEHVLAGVGALSAGAASKIGKAILKSEALVGISVGLNKGTDAIFRSSRKMIQVGQELGLLTKYDIHKHAEVILHWKSSFKLSKIDDAIAVNAKFGEPAYLRNTKVFDFFTQSQEKFVRVHGLDNQARPWIMRAEDIKGLSATEIAKKYNLPEIPQQISEVTLPANTRLKVGLVGPNKYGDSQGAVQYYIKMPEGIDVPEPWFKMIGDIF